MKNTVILALCFMISMFAAVAFAGGPLGVVNGKAVVYNASDFPVSYSTDQGTLGSLSNEQATQLVGECFAVWEAVATATITFINVGMLSEDVVALNYYSFEDSTDGINPIIFDSDGGIVDSVFGRGSSNQIIGFAGSDYDTATGYFTEGMALLNGVFADYFTYDQFKATFVHEFGHFFGLDHCQINTEYAGDGNTVNDAYIPTMFPTSTDDDTDLGDLNPDDVAAITMLYPVADGSVEAAYGTITGAVRWDNGGVVRGANVVAVKSGDEEFSRFSSVSDYFMQNDGVYSMYVTPGTYSLFIEAINPEFSGGSGVGPYSDNSFSESFTSPVETAWYEGTVTVSAGETVNGIDFVATPAPVGCAVSALVGGDRAVLDALRAVRDNVISRTAAGRALIRNYYRYEGSLAALLKGSPVLSKALGAVLKATVQ